MQLTNQIKHYSKEMMRSTGIFLSIFIGICIVIYIIALAVAKFANAESLQMSFGFEAAIIAFVAIASGTIKYEFMYAQACGVSRKNFFISKVVVITATILILCCVFVAFEYIVSAISRFSVVQIHISSLEIINNSAPAAQKNILMKLLMATFFFSGVSSLGSVLMSKLNKLQKIVSLSVLGFFLSVVLPVGIAKLLSVVTIFDVITWLSGNISLITMISVCIYLINQTIAFFVIQKLEIAK